MEHQQQGPSVATRHRLCSWLAAVFNSLCGCAISVTDPFHKLAPGTLAAFGSMRPARTDQAHS